MVFKKFISKDKFRRELVANYELERKKLNAISQNLDLSISERYQARLSLHLLPRDSSLVRIRNRCILTGRPRSIHRKFKLSRIMIRELSSKKLIPGLKKSSW